MASETRFLVTGADLLDQPSPLDEIERELDRRRAELYRAGFRFKEYRPAESCEVWVRQGPAEVAAAVKVGK